MKPAQLSLKPSLQLACLFALVGMFAIAIVACMPFRPLFIAVCILIIFSSMTYSIACHALLMLPWSYQLMALNKDNEIVLTQKNAKCFTVKVLPTSLVMPLLTVLNIKTKGGLVSRSVILLTDSADPNEARLWRVWLKWGLKT